MLIREAVAVPSCFSGLLLSLFDCWPMNTDNLGWLSRGCAQPEQRLGGIWSNAQFPAPDQQ